MRRGGSRCACAPVCTHSAFADTHNAVHYTCYVFETEEEGVVMCAHLEAATHRAFEALIAFSESDEDKHAATGDHSNTA